MISVTRINGTKIYINAELIQTVEETPDTVITLLNDRKLIVRDRADDLADRVIEYQRKIHQPFSVDRSSPDRLQG
jgi:flagellar protein FlbD